MQVKIIRLLVAFPNIKIIVEKPIVTNQISNQEILELFSEQSNLFISRPWNFSQLWLKFKENLLNSEYISKIEITHSGEIVRDYISPPQDWLHHDICLIQDLNLDLMKNYTLNKKIWSNDDKNLLVNIGEGPYIEIKGGYSADRISIFKVFFHNGSSVKMDMNRRNFSIQALDERTKIVEFRDEMPINSMVEHFIKTEINDSSKKHELKILQDLQILAI